MSNDNDDFWTTEPPDCKKEGVFYWARVGKHPSLQSGTAVVVEYDVTAHSWDSPNYYFGRTQCLSHWSREPIAVPEPPKEPCCLPTPEQVAEAYRKEFAAYDPAFFLNESMLELTRYYVQASMALSDKEWETIWPQTKELLSDLFEDETPLEKTRELNPPLENVVKEPTRMECYCKQCQHKNDVEEMKCWWCEAPIKALWDKGELNGV